MGITDQIKKIKDNWLIASALLIVVLVLLFSGNLFPTFLEGNLGYGRLAGSGYAEGLLGYGSEKMIAEASVARMGYIPNNDNFAPEVENRKITRTASLFNEVRRGTFKEAEEELKSIIISTDSYLISENVYKYGMGRNSYYRGSYLIKAEVKKYDSIISQLKRIGEITSFSENSLDETGGYTNLQIELAAEKERLKRYQEMYAETATVNEKIDLSDRLFNQERTIKYLEDALKNVDQRVEYSTVQVTLTEKQSEYINVAFVKLSELVRKLVNSVNGLLSLLFRAIPYALAVSIVWFIVRKTRKRK